MFKDGGEREPMCATVVEHVARLSFPWEGGGSTAVVEGVPLFV
jgi:hypothetical protein